MFSFILSVLAIILVIKIALSVGVGITKLLLGGLGIVAALFILPLSIALIVPIILIGAGIAILAFIFKLIF